MTQPTPPTSPLLAPQKDGYDTPVFLFFCVVFDFVFFCVCVCVVLCCCLCVSARVSARAPVSACAPTLSASASYCPCPLFLPLCPCPCLSPVSVSCACLCVSALHLPACCISLSYCILSCVRCCLFVFVHVCLCAPSKCVKTILSLCQLVPPSNPRDVHHMIQVTNHPCVICIM